MDTRLELLSAARINAVYQGLQDPRLLPQQLLFSQRIPMTDAIDEEIFARYIDTIQIADIIADDAKAIVYSQGKFQYETVKVPNLKKGVTLNQTQINQILRLIEQMAPGNNLGLFDSWKGSEANLILSCDLGVRQRIEMLLITMLVDNCNYDRLGIKLSGQTWGMPSDLKVTTALDWNLNPTTATPITDMQNVIRTARIRYGAYFNRITMSTQTLQILQATTQFQNQAKAWGWGQGALSGIVPTIPIQSDATIISLLTSILGGEMKIELYDARYWSQDSNGYTLSAPFFPINQVLFTDSRGDGNANYYDFANTIVTESVMSQVTRNLNMVGSLPLGRGPMSYATVDPSLNPPNITYWGVCRGFPRKKLLQSSAVLTAGAWTDPSIAVGTPFPS